jgi:transposase
MSEVLMMSKKERERKGLFEMVKQGHLTIKQASEQLGLSYRQGRRVYQAYIEEGDAGLIHKSRDQQSNRKHPHRKAILALYQEKYEGFGPTLASEYLLKKGYLVDHETLRRWLISEGLWTRQRKRKEHHPRRERRAQFGELLQMDGSIHDWFDEGKHSCLLNIVDDATGKTLAVMDSGETTFVIFRALWKWIEKYGVPLAVYVDLKTAYISPKEGQKSHFQKACEKLGIEVIKAYSPQAKGRVERNHRVYQDRFVKALRDRGIRTVEEANRFLETEFLTDLNQRFERKSRNPNTAHRELADRDLNQIFCLESERIIQHDWTFSFKGQNYQVKKEVGETIAPKSKIYVREHLDQELSFWHHDKAIHAVALSKEELLNQSQLEKTIEKSQPNLKERAKPHRNNSSLFQPNYSTSQKEYEIRAGHSMPYGH